ncbi:hypothetical protein [Bacillus wiedmannii]|uniref:Uncharacterized protein n=1 Tax=Bacillus wiedmannii TaxID=1890302 RepID=A0ABX5DPH3_9BACI|nr:hypothetical protein [Bacillus wiedmannii]PRT38269.1 hypothetical protein C6357_21315 [Bacillus wiedmannii]
MKKNKLLSVLLSFALAFGLGLTLLSFPTASSAEVGDKWSNTLTAKDGSATERVSVAPGYGHVKLQVINNGKAELTVKLTHSSGKVYIPDEKVKPGGVFNWKSNDYNAFINGVRAGRYELSFHSSDAPLNVTYYGKTQDSKW